MYLVFVVKYRKKIISNNLSFFLKVIIKQIEERSDFRVECLETDKEHIHLLVDYNPRLSILQIVRRLKQETTFKLWRAYSSYLKKFFWKEHTFWSDGYFACSIGEGASYETIQEYIKNQG